LIAPTVIAKDRTTLVNPRRNPMTTTISTRTLDHRRNSRRDTRPDRLGVGPGQGDDMIPIPGTKRDPYLEENAAAATVALSAADLDRLGGLSGRTIGARAVDPGWINRSTRAVES
jgi:hypothetical protein